MDVRAFMELQAGDIVRIKNCPVNCTILRRPVFYDSGIPRTDAKPINSSLRTFYSLTAGSVTRVVDTAEDEIMRRER